MATTSSKSTLKRVAIADLRPGMYVSRLDGNWLSHSFWRTRFVIGEGSGDLERLRDSGLSHVWIDTAKGVDLFTPSAVAPLPEPPAMVAQSPVPAAEPTCTLREELARCASVCRQTQEAMRNLFADARLGLAVEPERCVEPVQNIVESVSRHPTALVSLARLKSADDYTHLHSVAVCALMVNLARTLGLDEASQRDAGLAGLLHDVGKARIPLEVLNKPGSLTPAEFEVMKKHPQAGLELLGDSADWGASARDVCLHHHERPDGKGYPFGLAGDRLSQMARMGAVCDVYDAITSDRPYKSRWDPAISLSRMASWSGQFDPLVLQAFVKSLGIYPVGSLVELASGQVGVVCDQTPDKPLTPQVKVFFCQRRNQAIEPRVVDLSQGEDRIVARLDPEPWSGWPLDDLWRVTSR